MVTKFAKIVPKMDDGIIRTLMVRVMHGMAYYTGSPAVSALQAFG